MLPLPVKVVLLGGIVGFALSIGWEIWRWIRGQSRLAREQFWRRMIVGVTLEIDLVMWLFADVVLRSGGTTQDKLFKLQYIGAATLLVLIPLYLAVKEIKFIARQYAEWRKELIRGVARPERSDNGDVPV